MSGRSRLAVLLVCGPLVLTAAAACQAPPAPGVLGTSQHAQWFDVVPPPSDPYEFGIEGASFRHAVGDWNGDGLLDVVQSAVDYEDDAGVFLFTNVDGQIYNYPGMSIYHPSQTGLGVSLVDWDEDGDVDISAGWFQDPITIYENVDGLPVTAPVWESPTSLYARSLEWADADGDGDLDLLVQQFSEPLLYFENTHDINNAFTAPVTAVDTAGSLKAVWGDFDGDGDPDYAVSTYDGNPVAFTIQVFENTTLNPPVPTIGLFQLSWESGPLVAQVADLAWADFDSDGDLDLAAAGGSGYDTVWVNRVDEGLGFTDDWYATPIPGGGSDLVVWGDWDCDGTMDVVFAALARDPRVYTFPVANRPNHSPDPTEVITAPDGEHVSDHIGLADLDGDAVLELVRVRSGEVLTLPNNSVLANLVYDGSRPLPLPDVVSTVDPPDGGVRDMAWGDLDGDGVDELVILEVTEAGSDVRFVTFEDGSASTTALGWAFSSTPWALALGDLDLDGDLDLAVGTSGSAEDHVFENDGAGLFAATPAWTSPAGSDTRDVAWVDLDVDGDLDLLRLDHGLGLLVDENVAADSASPSPPLLGASQTLASSPGENRLALADYDGDGDADFALCGGTEASPKELQLYNNPATPLSPSLPQVPLTPVWTSYEQVACSDLALADFNGDSLLDLVATPGPSIAVGVWEGKQQASPASAPLGAVTVCCFNWPETNSPASTSSWTSIAVADIDGDGFTDFALGGEPDGGEGVTVYRNRYGYPTFWEDWPPPATAWPATGPVTFGDVDDDGDVDLVVGAPVGSPSGPLFRVYASARVGPPLLPQNPGVPRVSVPAAGGGFDRAERLLASDVPVEVTVVDADSDLYFAYHLEYSEGGSTWTEGTLVGAPPTLASSPTGVTTTLYWDAETDAVLGGNLSRDGIQIRVVLHRQAANTYVTPIHRGAVASRPVSLGLAQCYPFDSDFDGVHCSEDCDDTDASIHPSAEEACDSIDSDCDGDLLDGFSDFDGDLEADCTDLDDDNDGDPDASDCNDEDAGIHTGAAEVCDGLDTDCNGLDDYGAPGQDGQEPDTDGDGEHDCLDLDDDGDGFDDVLDCGPLDSSVYPNAPESCDSIDSDCDGSLVDEFEDLDADGVPDCVDPDADGDGYPLGSDCNDGDYGINPGQTDTPGDGVDQDCSGVDTAICYQDSDGDGFGGLDEIYAEDGNCLSIGALSVSDDCDDADASSNPAAEERCDDGADNDCDGAESRTGDDPDCWPRGLFSCSANLASSPLAPGAPPLLLTLLLLMFGVRERRRK